MSNTPFIAIIFFILGSIACHLYKRHTIRDLEDGLAAWKMQAEISAERFNSWRCLRPHLGDINSIQQEIEDATGISDAKLNELIDELDVHIKNLKEIFEV
jgi:hypothetical protein